MAAAAQMVLVEGLVVVAPVFEVEQLVRPATQYASPAVQIAFLV